MRSRARRGPWLRALACFRFAEDADADNEGLRVPQLTPSTCCMKSSYTNGTVCSGPGAILPEPAAALDGGLAGHSVGPPETGIEPDSAVVTSPVGDARPASSREPSRQSAVGAGDGGLREMELFMESMMSDMVARARAVTTLDTAESLHLSTGSLNAVSTPPTTAAWNEVDIPASLAEGAGTSADTDESHQRLKPAVGCEDPGQRRPHVVTCRFTANSDPCYGGHNRFLQGDVSPPIDAAFEVAALSGEARLTHAQVPSQPDGVRVARGAVNTTPPSRLSSPTVFDPPATPSTGSAGQREDAVAGGRDSPSCRDNDAVVPPQPPWCGVAGQQVGSAKPRKAAGRAVRQGPLTDRSDAPSTFGRHLAVGGARDDQGQGSSCDSAAVAGSSVGCRDLADSAAGGSDLGEPGAGPIVRAEPPRRPAESLLSLLAGITDLSCFSTRGSLSGLWLGTWSDRPVIIKLACHPEGGCASSLAARAAMRVRHPNLLTVHDVRALAVSEQSLLELDPPPALRAGWSEVRRPPGQLHRFLAARKPFPTADRPAAAGPSLTVYPGDMVPQQKVQSLAQQALLAIRPRVGTLVVATVVEYCEMGNLHSLLGGEHSPFRARRSWPLHVAQRALLRTAREVASAVRALHSAGIAHGSLQPNNVLLSRSNKDRRGFAARVADAGSVSLSHAASNPLAMGPCMVLLAPEALADASSIGSPAADSYAFGMLLYLMAAGEMPFQGQHLVSVLMAVASDGLQPEWPTGQHDHLEPLFRRCVARLPGERPDFKQIVAEVASLELGIKGARRGKTIRAAVPRDARTATKNDTAAWMPAAPASRRDGGEQTRGPRL